MTTPIAKIWNVNSGPYADEEIDDLYFLECLIEDEDEVVEVREVYFPSINSAYAVEKYFKVHAKPLTMEEVLETIEGTG